MSTDTDFAAPRPTTVAPERRPTFADVVRSEWTKFHTMRSTRVVVIAVVVAMVGLGAVISAGTARGFVRLTPEEQAAFDPTLVSLRAYFPVQWLVGVLGALVMTVEYRTGMIRSTLAAVPRRGRLLAAKALVYGVVVAVLGQAVAFGAFLVGQPMLAAQNAPTAALGDPGVTRAVCGAGLYLAGIGLLGLALGTLVRATVGAFAILVALPLLPTVLPLLPAGIGEDIAEYWPTVAGERVMFVVDIDGGLAPWPGLALFLGFVAVVHVAAYAALRVRDA
ncbi:ABC transporter permease [Micromonospora sp. NPDC005707]|uniref:ABC transporter permease n=1 Tax=Micromonospora sp. NPDC005707 TaxID=3157050 RepID=UPI00340BFE7E